MRVIISILLSIGETIKYEKYVELNDTNKISRRQILLQILVHIIAINQVGKASSISE